MLLSTALNPELNAIALSPSAKVLILTDLMDDVSKIINMCKTGDVVFIDIDDTIQTITSYLFQTSPSDPLSEGARMIESIKQAHISSFEDFISRWRLSRRIQLVHQDWPVLIEQAQKRGVLVYGLTQMSTGACGVMSRVEEWRIHELGQLGICFTPTYLDQEDLPLMTFPESTFQWESPPVFYKGVFFTGSIPKDKKNILQTYLKDNHPDHIVMIDDCIQQIQWAQEIPFECSFTGIVFRGVDRVVRPVVSPDLYQKIIDLQKEHLSNGQWLENDEAMAVIDLSLSEL